MLETGENNEQLLFWPYCYHGYSNISFVLSSSNPAGYVDLFGGGRMGHIRVNPVFDEVKRQPRRIGKTRHKLHLTLLC